MSVALPIRIALIQHSVTYHEHADLGGQSSFGCWDEMVDDGLNVEEESGGFRRMNCSTANEMRDM